MLKIYGRFTELACTHYSDAAFSHFRCCLVHHAKHHIRIIAPNDNPFTWAGQRVGSPLGNQCKAIEPPYITILFRNESPCWSQRQQQRQSTKNVKIIFGWVIKFRVPKTITSLPREQRREKKIVKEPNALVLMGESRCHTVCACLIVHHIHLKWICK